MSDKFRIAVLGLGDWARRAYLPNIELMDDVELAAVCTRSKANMSAALESIQSEPRTYHDYADLLADGELDGVVVATAASSHREIAGTVLRAGFPVLCEKPLALMDEDCDALAADAEAAGVPLQVGLEFRHAPVLVAADGYISEGKIGTPSILECQIFRDKRANVLEAPPKWTEQGGVFTEFLCHYLDVLMWFSASEPIAVSCSAGRRLGTAVWDNGVINIEHANGAIATLSYAFFAPKSAERLALRVLGDAGALDIGLKEGTVSFRPSDLDAQSEDVAMLDPGHPSKPYPGSYEQIRSFIETAKQRSTPAVTAAMWRQVMAVANAADRSAETGERVEL